MKYVMIKEMERLWVTHVMGVFPLLSSSKGAKRWQISAHLFFNLSSFKGTQVFFYGIGPADCSLVENMSITWFDCRLWGSAHGHLYSADKLRCSLITSQTGKGQEKHDPTNNTWPWQRSLSVCAVWFPLYSQIGPLPFTFEVGRTRLESRRDCWHFFFFISDSNWANEILCSSSFIKKHKCLLFKQVLWFQINTGSNMAKGIVSLDTN